MIITTADGSDLGVHIRPTTGIDDMAAVIRIHGRAWKVAHRKVLPPAVLEQTTVDADRGLCQAWLANIDDETDRFFVAMDEDEQVLGYLHLRLGEASEASIVDLAVDPDHWRDGIGTALFERAYDELPARTESMLVEMIAGNGVARLFYEHLGFERTGYRPTTIDGELYPVACYRMECISNHSMSC